MNKEKLIKKLKQYKESNKKLSGKLSQKNNEITHFKRRLKKIRDSIDYLIEHPFSKDTSYITRPHKRDKGEWKHGTQKLQEEINWI